MVNDNTDTTDMDTGTNTDTDAPPTVCDGLAVRGTVRAALYDVADLDAHHKSWREFPDRFKLELFQHVEPLVTSEQSNVTCVGLHEWIADALNGATTPPAPPEEIALGRSDAATASSDTALTDPVDRVGITSFADEGDQMRITTFVGEDEANVDTGAGETISEVGAYAPDYSILNHALFDTEYEKDDTKTMTVEIVLAFSAA